MNTLRSEKFSLSIERREKHPTYLIEIEPDPEKISSYLAALDKLYDKILDKKLSLPTVKNIPPTMKKYELESFYGGKINTFSTGEKKRKRTYIELPQKYAVFKKIEEFDAEETPIIDSYYFTVISRGKWSYYVPWNSESLEENDNVYYPGTKYLINWEDGLYFKYPSGLYIKTTVEPERTFMHLLKTATMVRINPPTDKRYINKISSADTSIVPRLMELLREFATKITGSEEVVYVG